MTSTRSQMIRESTKRNQQNSYHSVLCINERCVTNEDFQNCYHTYVSVTWTPDSVEPTNTEKTYLSIHTKGIPDVSWRAPVDSNHKTINNSSHLKIQSTSTSQYCKLSRQTLYRELAHLWRQSRSIHSWEYKLQNVAMWGTVSLR
jgi:hypothetical protein